MQSSPALPGPRIFLRGYETQVLAPALTHQKNLKRYAGSAPCTALPSGCHAQWGVIGTWNTPTGEIPVRSKIVPS